MMVTRWLIVARSSAKSSSSSAASMRRVCTAFHAAAVNVTAPGMRVRSPAGVMRGVTVTSMPKSYCNRT